MKHEPIIVEFLDGRGRVLTRERFLLDPNNRILKVGRSVAADVTVDDEHCAPIHAAVEVSSEGKLRVTDLGSINGIIVQGKRHHGISDMSIPGSDLQIGRTRIRIRTMHEAIAQEKPDLIETMSRLVRPSWAAAVAVAALTAHLVYSTWMTAPREFLLAFAAPAGGTAILLAGWVFVWALLSRIMRSEWRWLHHTAIIACAVALFGVVGELSDLLSYAFSLQSTFNQQRAWLGSLIGGGAVYLHLLHASTLTPRHAGQIAAVFCMILAGIIYWAQRMSDRDVTFVANQTRIYPPALRFTPSESASVFFTRLPKLRELADENVKTAIEVDPDPDEGAPVVRQ